MKLALCLLFALFSISCATQTVSVQPNTNQNTIDVSAPVSSSKIDRWKQSHGENMGKEVVFLTDAESQRYLAAIATYAKKLNNLPPKKVWRLDVSIGTMLVTLDGKQYEFYVDPGVSDTEGSAGFFFRLQAIDGNTNNFPRERCIFSYDKVLQQGTLSYRTYKEEGGGNPITNRAVALAAFESFLSKADRIAGL